MGRRTGGSHLHLNDDLHFYVDLHVVDPHIDDLHVVDLHVVEQYHHIDQPDDVVDFEQYNHIDEPDYHDVVDLNLDEQYNHIDEPEYHDVVDLNHIHDPPGRQWRYSELHQDCAVGQSP